MLPVLDVCREWFSGLFPEGQWRERRRWPRAPLHARLAVTAGSGCVYHASARDHNATGIGAIVCGDLQVGETVLLKIGDRKIRGTVRNRSGYRYGFEFLQ